MIMNSFTRLTISGIALFFCAQTQAHISITTEPVYANTRSVVTLNIPHGCDGADTYRIEISLPENFTSTRPMDNNFGKASITTNDDGNVTKLTWTKNDKDLLDTDSHLYQMTFRSKLPDTPFVVAFMPTVQFCRDADGMESTNEWVGTGGHDNSSTERPAPAMTIFPARFKGWNQYTVEAHINNLSIFNDAEIVWVDSSAYSPNPNTQSLIENDTSVSVLDEIQPGTEIWVKY